MVSARVSFTRSIQNWLKLKSYWDERQTILKQIDFTEHNPWWVVQIDCVNRIYNLNEVNFIIIDEVVTLLN